MMERVVVLSAMGTLAAQFRVLGLEYLRSGSSLGLRMFDLTIH